MSMDALDQYLGGLKEKIERTREIQASSSEGSTLFYSELLPSFVLLSAGVVRSYQKVRQVTEDTIASNLDIDPGNMFDARIKIVSNLKDYINGSDYVIEFTREAATHIEDARLHGFVPVKNVIVMAAEFDSQMEIEVREAKASIFQELKV